MFPEFYRGIGLSAFLSLADAPQPMPNYKFIVSSIKSNPYYISIPKTQIIYIQMQNSNIDTLKFQVSLINKLKNQEPIDINNKLISVGIGSITSNHLKLLVETESCNDHTLNLETLHEIEKKAHLQAKDWQQNQQQKQINRLIQIKIKVLVLMKEMKGNDANLSLITAHQLVTLINTHEEMKFVLQLLFRVKSLSLLEKINAYTIITAKLDSKLKEALMFMIVLIKLHNHPVEATDIIVNQLNGKYTKEKIQQEKKAVLTVLKVLLEKEKQLTENKKNHLIEQNSCSILNKQSTKTQIKNKFYTEYKIDLEKPKEQCQEQIATLSQKNYLLASPLQNYYHQNDQNVLQNLVKTAIHKKINSPKTKLNSSLIASSAFKQKQKLKIKYMKNSEQWSKYLKLNAKLAQDCSKDCALGEYFVKYNFNNLNSSLKYVIFNKSSLLWGKNKTAILQDSTAVKIKNIVGILYGKVSSRFQESEDKGLCFSFLLKDRTVDFAIAKETEGQALRRFVMGASFVLNSYHSGQTQKWRVQKQLKKGQQQIQDIKTKINYHQYKVRQVTSGKLLWRDLFNNLASKTNNFESQLFPKAKLLVQFSKRQSKSQKKQFSQSETKKAV